MRRFFKISSYTLSTIILILVVVPLLLSLILQTSSVQTYVVRVATSIISSKLDSKISIGKIDIKTLYNISIYDIFVESKLGPDTLLYAKELTTRISALGAMKGEIGFDFAQLNNAQLTVFANDSITNIKNIIQKLEGDKQKDSTKNFILKIGSIEVNNLKFRYLKQDAESVEYGINYQDIELNNTNIRVKNFTIVNDSISMTIKSLSGEEKSDVKINNLKFNLFSITPRLMNFEDGEGQIDDNSYFKLKYAKIIYKDWDMQDFVNRIPMDCYIESSKFHLATVAKFTKQRRKWSSVAEFSGTFGGTVSNMRGSIHKANILGTTLDNTSYRISGIPNIEQTRFIFNTTGITTNLADIAAVISDFSNSGEFKLPDNIGKDAEFTVLGTFDGKLDDFNAACNIKMADKKDGTLKAGIHLKITPSAYIIDGNVATKNINIRKFFSVKGLERITTNLNLKGKLERGKSAITLRGVIDSVYYNNYNYNGIKLNGNVENKSFIGYVGCNDKNIDFEFNGMLDFSKKISAYNFNLDVKELDLVAIKLNTRDSVSIFSGRVLADGSGDKIDQIDATIVIDQLKYINHQDTTIADKKIRIEARNNQTRKYINIDSEYLTLDFKGVHSYSELIDYLKRSFNRYFPALDSKGLDSGMGKKERVILPQSADDFFYITANIRKGNNLANIFIPTLSLASGSKLSFVINPTADSFSLVFSSDFIELDNNLVSNISLDAKNEDDSITIFARAEEVTVGDMFFPNCALIGSLKNNTIYADLGFTNSSDSTYAIVKTYSEIGHNEAGNVEYKIAVRPSTINLYKDVWTTKSGVIRIDSARVVVDNFMLASKGQSLNVNGIISNNMNDSLKVTLNNFSLSLLSLFTSKMGYNINGGVSGYLLSYGVKNAKDRYLISEVDFKTLNINDKPIDDIKFVSNRDRKKQEMDFHISSDNTRYISGNLSPVDGSYFVSAKIPQFDVSFISPFLSGIAEDLSGVASVDVNISNPKGYFEINGKVDIPKISALIAPTNTKYNITASAVIENNQYRLTSGTVTDDFGGKGTITATMTNDKYKKVKYDIIVRANDMLCLNTTYKLNPTFYGRAFATGNVRISGDRNKVTLGVDATSSRKSSFVLPLGGKVISEASFIKFANKDIDQTSDTRKKFIKQKEVLQNKTAFEMKMRINATPLLESEIVMDQTSGSSIKATGSGTLDIDIRPNDEVFTINGEYSIDKGTYRFILPSFKIVDKIFTIKNGSWIRWAGDPMDAALNVNAIYEVKTSIAPLIGSTKERANRVNVDCILSLTDKLMQPNITLAIEVPDANPEDQGAIRAQLNTPEAISTQLFYLLATSSFYATTGQSETNSTIGLMGTTTTGIEFLTNQIKNIISSDKFDFGFNYRPTSEISSSEFEIDFSAPILSNKLYLDITGNYNFLDGPSTTTNKNWSGDFYLTWLLNSSGNLSMKGFSKRIDTFDENQGLQDNGVGVYFKVDFDNFKDLRTKYLNYFRSLREKRKKRAESKDNNK